MLTSNSYYRITDFVFVSLLFGRKNYRGYTLESRLHFRIHAIHLQLNTLQNLDTPNSDSPPSTPIPSSPVQDRAGTAIDPTLDHTSNLNGIVGLSRKENY